MKKLKIELTKNEYRLLRQVFSCANKDIAYSNQKRHIKVAERHNRLSHKIYMQVKKQGYSILDEYLRYTVKEKMK